MNATRNHITNLTRAELLDMAVEAVKRADNWKRLGEDAARVGDVALINECRDYEVDQRCKARALYYRARIAEF